MCAYYFLVKFNRIDRQVYSAHNLVCVFYSLKKWHIENIPLDKVIAPKIEVSHETIRLNITILSKKRFRIDINIIDIL